MKNVLADGRGGCVADGRLRRSRVVAKMFVFIISRNFLIKFLIFCFAKFSSNFAKIKIILSKFRETHAVSQPPYVGVE